MVPERDLLERIEKFIAAAPGMTKWSFGHAAIKDTNLVDDLHAGRELRQKTRRRIEAFMLDSHQQISEAVQRPSNEVAA